MINDMRLLKIEKTGEETLYFSTLTKCANYIGSSVSNVRSTLHGLCKQCKGYEIEWIESDDVLSKYIDREKVN